MKKSYICFFIWALCISAAVCNGQSKQIDSVIRRLANATDLSLPEWGPYSKRYAGLTHIADKQQGITFDVIPVTGFYRGKLVVPNHTFESGFHPWAANASLSTYSFREEIAWKDKVYADVQVSDHASGQKLMKIVLNNRTPDVQYLGLNLLANINFPDVNPVVVKLPVGRQWIHGTGYTQLNYSKPRPDDNLRPDGLRKGERRGSEYTGGSALADDFGKTPGDKVSFRLKVAQYTNPYLLIRYKAAPHANITLQATGAFTGILNLEGTGKMGVYTQPINNLSAQNAEVTFTTLTSNTIEIDGFAIVNQDEIGKVSFNAPAKEFVPIVEKGKNWIVLKYPGLPQYYGLAWQANDEAIIRNIYGKNPDVSLRKVAGDNVYPDASDMLDGCFTNVFIRPIPLQPMAAKTVNVLIGKGTQQQVKEMLSAFGTKGDSKSNTTADETSEIINPESKPYLFSYNMLRATLLQNVIFPVYKNGQYTKSFVGGKRWQSLYTWDSGFIGLGLTDIDITRAIEELNAYTTAIDDTNVFVQHGSLVPVQFFLMQQIWDRTQSETLLKYFYPRLRRYYLFYTGQYGSSTTSTLKSGLLSPFHYFYNSGGWDDYPAQVFMHDQHLSQTTTPVINTAMAIRIAKIMAVAASLSGHKNDAAGYNNDIARFSKAIQLSWDGTSGYFGYQTHQPASGAATGILKTPTAENFNKGLDGTSPLIAGACTPTQQQALVKHLFNPAELWSAQGITTVDQSASYFSPNGYWNGTVWFAHQWFIWKAMLDVGQGDRAFQIAKTALDVYKKEVDSTYNCYELFRLATSKGNGWHQFSSLSAPVINWFSAYFKPGTVTAGLNCWTTKLNYVPGQGSLDVSLLYRNAEPLQTVLICMPSGQRYQVTVNGLATSYKENIAGVLEINIPGKPGKKETVVGVRRVN